MLDNVGHRVMEVRHLPHVKREECVIEFVLATPVEEDAEAGAYVFRVEGSHDLSEAVRKYGDETKGDDVLVIMPGENLQYAIMPRQKFHEATKQDLRSQAAKYIR
jgi:hypothetical protein